MASPLSPKDGVAWVTGASSGIGRDTALQLAREGWTVAVTARSADDLIALAQSTGKLKGSIHAFPGDVTQPERMAEIVGSIADTLGPLALAVLNAGVYLPVDARQFSASAFTPTFQVNLIGVANCLEPAIAAMRAAGQGQIAIVASVTGYGGLPTSAAYGASKAALINLAETLCIELDPVGIRVQVVNPGFIDTPATKDNPFPMPALMQPEKAARRITAGLRSNRFEITFPRRFTYVLKLLGLLPTQWRLGLIRKVTGWGDPDTTPDVPTGD
jgi:NAD(P)-dependent dehydrogenase (short-subunit alcohol dehydrogenase family)